MSDHPNKNTPIILLTANALSGAREQFLAAGFDDYMTKPIDGRKLEELLIRYLPKDKVILNAGGHADERSDEEEFLEKLNINAGLDTDQGLSNCGSVDGYREVIEIYLDSVEAKAAEIEKYYKEKDYENYTIQVHSLKSTSRVIGAVEIGELAAKLEQAGDKKNTEMINAETDILLNDIRELGRKLSDIMPGQDTVNEEELAEIDDSMLDDAYTTLSEFAAMMDYEDAGFVLDELKGYKLSDKEQERVNAIHNAVEKLDWDTVTKLISERGGR
jgi:HPt (histidine-containing phosphotransfer) domain-containing protein